VRWAVRKLAAWTLILLLGAGCRQAPTPGYNVESFRHYVDSLNVIIDSLQRADRYPAPRALHPITDVEIDDLRRRGLKDPIRELVADLQRHPELIPFQAPRGMAQFGFYDTNGIHVLSGGWVWGRVEDGHWGTSVLMEYRVSPGGKIEWKYVRAEQEGG